MTNPAGATEPTAPPLFVHLWLMETAGFAADRWIGVLGEGERARAARFLRGSDRRDYVAAHVLARLLLARLGAGEPAAIAFRAGEYGKPLLAGGGPDLRFNLTHTDGLVAVAAGQGVDIGADAEALDRPRVDDELASLVFTAAELATLDRLDGDAWTAAFFRLWTLKEATVKMLGTGLSMPLHSLQVLGDPPRLEFLHGSRRPARHWHLEVGAPTRRHMLALAVACAGRPVAVRRRVLDADTLAEPAGPPADRPLATE